MFVEYLGIRQMPISLTMLAEQDEGKVVMWQWLAAVREW